MYPRSSNPSPSTLNLSTFTLHTASSIASSLFTLSVILALVSGLFFGCDEGAPTGGLTPEAESSEGVHTANSAKVNGAKAGNASDVIPGQYIVVFRDGVGNVASKAKGLAKAHGGEVIGTWTTALRGFAVKNLPEAAIAALENNPNVKYVEQDVIVRGTVRKTVGSSPGDAWGLDRVDQRSGFDGLFLTGATGAGVTVYVLDSGIRLSHYTFGNRITSGYDFVDNDADASDCNGHGTHVAGTAGGYAYGVAGGADLVAVRVLNCNNAAPSVGTVIDGVNWIMNNHSGGPAVINMSLGGPPSSPLDTAVRNAINAGFVSVIAAGNDDTNACNFSPARVTEGITVAASDINDNRASFSNYGPCVDLFAPGVAIKSAWIGSDSDTRSINGTSMAAPHVAGTAALYLENNPGASPQQVRDAIVQTSTKNIISNSQTSNNHLLFSLLTHPKAPSNLNASCSGSYPRITWTASPSSDVDFYEVFRSPYTGSNGYSKIGTSTDTEFTGYVTCAGSNNIDGEYYYRVRAVDTEGLASGESNKDGILYTSDPPYGSYSNSDSLHVAQ